MATHLPINAAITPVRIILLLFRPSTDSIHGGPRGSAAPVYILAELEIVFRERVCQLAVLLPLPGPPPGVVSQLRIPHEWQLHFSRPDQVVAVQELHRLSHAVPA
ncbi:hypothetical protein MIMGU_mgv1a016857mg [Erythranthe guttata]|uniref:Uncharacterized protein n=1 Tax=Erythranthe guttata TaxID=4155 RepID=A0A022R0P3_ERYGU|nr:hypothetical protein MIMGU_mgv1a016857mg [Erythranthe guttata]